jgi:beta-glucosidase/6-phospho-beta-glucosidase/beta-galactosidase
VLATSYYERYGLPIFHCKTNRPSPDAVEWLERQWREVLGLRAAGVPVRGFTWYPLTDQVDWQYGLRAERNEVYPVGLFDLDRVSRSVGRAYGELAWRWRPRLGSPGDGYPAHAA